MCGKICYQIHIKFKIHVLDLDETRNLNRDDETRDETETKYRDTRRDSRRDKLLINVVNYVLLKTFRQ